MLRFCYTRKLELTESLLSGNLSYTGITLKNDMLWNNDSEKDLCYPEFNEINY